MLEAPHYSAVGTRREGAFALPAEYFDGTVNQPVLHQAVRTYLNNQRQGTHQTKTRSFVSGGNQKPWRQKGTGRARQGSIRAPHWRGGGTVFGPQPRDYRTDMPRKVRLLARRSALNARAAHGGVCVVEGFAFDAPRTARMVELLTRLGLAERKVLVLTHGHRTNVYLSARNLPNVHVMAYPEASAYEILWSDAVVVEQGALTGDVPEITEDPGVLDTRTPRPKREAAEKPAKKKKATKAEKAAKTAKAAKSAKAARPARKTAKKTARKGAKKAARKPAKKPAARKPAPKKKKGDK
ncbi:MAG: 50S ribosomal protein L4 [Gemmatimonadales bacterium]